MKPRDMKYQKQVDALISKAVKYADENKTTIGGRNARAAAWNSLFHKRMDELTLARGIRRLAWQVP